MTTYVHELLNIFPDEFLSDLGLEGLEAGRNLCRVHVSAEYRIGMEPSVPCGDDGLAVGVRLAPNSEVMTME